LRARGQIPPVTRGLSALDRPQREWTIEPSVNFPPIVAAKKAFALAGIKAAIGAQQPIVLCHRHGLAKANPPKRQGVSLRTWTRGCTFVSVMKVLGIDFTSRPSRRKPIACVRCTLDGGVLRVDSLEEWHDFAAFESALAEAGPWIAGVVFPFGQSRKFIENIGWSRSWPDYVAYVGSLARKEFRDALTRYRAPRPIGDKEHRRATDIAASSISPQKLHGVPVGLMFFEGAPRLLRSGVTIPQVLPGVSTRIVVEGYPGVLARQIIGRTAYKSDNLKKQTEQHRQARLQILNYIVNGQIDGAYGVRVEAPNTLAEDPTGDQLDALLCAIQAAWAWTMRENNYGAPRDPDSLEGWIADPGLH
jgi:hypothetical protein